MNVTEAQLSDTLLEALASFAQNRLTLQYGDPSCPGFPYGWQLEFHEAGRDNSERAVIAANQVGKTRSAAAEVAIHVTGRYPDWWKGHRYPGAIEAIVSGVTNEDVRDIQQLALFGPIVEGKRPEGTGWVPRECIGKFAFRQCGVSDVLDTVRVRHVNGSWSDIQFKSYEQDPEKYAGRVKDLIWLDEEPDDFRLFSECQTRLLVKKGKLIFTATPLKGMSEIVRHFIEGGPGIWYKTVRWTDAPHISEAQRAEWTNRYPPHERDTRTKGIPMMGAGLVYPVTDDMILCAPFNIPTYFRRIAGCDFGIAHPGAGAWIAWDPDNDIIYLYDAYRQKGETPAYHAQAFNARGPWIPVAWPHDGLARDKGSGEPLATQYKRRGCNMLGEPASWDSDFLISRNMNAKMTQSREAGAWEILERMRTGRFKVFDAPGARLFVDEIHMLIRKGTAQSPAPAIVPINDDVESAARYAVMMLRYALTEEDADESAAGPVEKPYDPLEEFAPRRR